MIDPAVALPVPQRATLWREGPMPKVQFVVEMVGPRSVPASTAAHLLDVRWFEALGQPEAWCMSASDETWRPLTKAGGSAYDSLAISWDILSPRGRLSGVPCASLLARAEEFAGHIGRRAMAMPLPEEVDRLSKALEGVRNDLDVGFSLAYGPDSGFIPEAALWEQCQRLGLVLDESGAFDWRTSSHPLPLLMVTPIGATESFSAAARDRGEVHEGASIGFHVPRCPSVKEALVGCFHIGRVFSQALGGAIFDEEGNPVTQRTIERLTAEADQAEALFARAGIAPGSPEAAKLWC